MNKKFIDLLKSIIAEQISEVLPATSSVARRVAANAAKASAAPDSIGADPYKKRSPSGKVITNMSGFEEFGALKKVVDTMASTGPSAESIKPLKAAVRNLETAITTSKN